jgi:hypothetical protein
MRYLYKRLPFFKLIKFPSIDIIRLIINRRSSSLLLLAVKVNHLGHFGKVVADGPLEKVYGLRLLALFEQIPGLFNVDVWVVQLQGAGLDNICPGSLKMTEFSSKPNFKRKINLAK